MNNQQIDEIKSLNEIISLTPEQFTELMKAENTGFLNSVKNFIEMYYQQITVTKDSVLALVHKGENMPIEDKKEAEETLKDLYIVLQLLEDRHKILCAILDERNIG